MLSLWLLMQIAAPPQEVTIGEAQVRQHQMIARTRASSAIEQARTLNPDALHQALEQSLSDRTRMIYQEEHGIFVEYTGPAGELRTWYPGHRAVVTGRWGVQRFKKKLVNACFRYDRATSAPTGGFDPGDCVPPEHTLGGTDVLRHWRGDVFGLLGGSIPYVKSPLGVPEPLGL